MGISWQRAKGFTIVELLIVIVVIAILAAITIVSYNGITGRAKASAAQSAAETASKKVQTYMITNSDQVPPDLATAGITDSNGATYQYSSNNATNPQTFCITATTSNVSYYIDNTTHTSPTAGGCPGHAQNGGVAVTNLVTNPSFETNVRGWSNPGSLNVAFSTAWHKSGSQSITMTANGANNDTYLMFGDYGLALPLQPNTTYTAQAQIKVTTSSATAWASNGARQVTVWVYDGTTYIPYRGNQIANVDGAEGLSWVTFTTPPVFTQAFLRVYWGASSGAMMADSVMLTKGSTLYNYADPITNTSWVWNGAANDSTSTGPAL